MKNARFFRSFRWFLHGLFFLGLVSCAHAQSIPDSGWPTYANDPGGTRYSPLQQINRNNIAQLRVAWTYRTGALPYDPEELDHKAAFETTPILVDGKLFLSTPDNTGCCWWRVTSPGGCLGACCGGLRCSHHQ